MKFREVIVPSICFSTATYFRFFCMSSTPENDVMAFIDDDGSLEDHRKEDCRGPSSAMSLRPPHFQNGWGNSSSTHRSPVARKSETPLPPVNVNNNNNNNNLASAGSVVAGAAAGNVNNAGKFSFFFLLRNDDDSRRKNHFYSIVNAPRSTQCRKSCVLEN